MTAPSSIYQRGQALVIILLVLAVASTVSLSLVARTITDISITTKEKESSRAFSAAEAGIERALITSSAESGTLSGGESYNVAVSVVGGTRELTGFDLRAGDAFTIWFVSHADDGSLSCSGLPCFTGPSMQVCWGEPGTPSADSTTPALEFAILYTGSPGNFSTAKVARATFDPNTSRRAANNFSAAGGSCTIGNNNYAFNNTITFSDFGITSGTANILQMAKARLIYNPSQAHPTGVAASGSDLPSQGKKITSVGSLGEVKRSIEVIQSFPDLPPIFDFGLFSPSSLTK